MEEKLNEIATLSAVLDALNRAGKSEAINEVVAKILELVKKL